MRVTVNQGGRPVIQRFHHVAVRTTDIEAAVKFYSQALGSEEQMRLHFEDGSYLVQMSLGDSIVELFGDGKPAEEDPSRVGYTHIALSVDDVDAECERLKGLGCPFHVEPQTVQGLRVAFFRDPDGNPIELLQEL
jgi:lactoylglutathione lyase